MHGPIETKNFFRMNDLTRKELNAERKIFKNRVKTPEEIKADTFHAMGN